ncbi:MAG: FimV/HubP family polar landmark protein, partial [Gammaproteobacteria bacterium]|nr:FimV/HubP family polar landmark protein [Gammaproteobacteria bacterium]
AEAEAEVDEQLQSDAIDDIPDKASAESSAEMTTDTAAEDTLAGDIGTDGETAISEEVAVEESEVFLDKTLPADMPADANAAEENAAEPDQVAAPAISDVTPQQQPVDPLDKLLSDPVLLAAAGGGLLLIIAVIALIIKKRREASDETDSFELDTSDNDLDSLADDVATGAITTESLAEDRAEGSDIAGEDNFNSDLNTDLDATDDVRDSTLSDAEGTESRDDVIAEADVYLAYGIYQQAEELLMQAIADSPERDDYRVKLAETHYASKNEEAFINVATELKARVDDESPTWNKVMTMGQDLCADNPLFQGRMVSGLGVGSQSEKEPEMDFDLGIDGSASSKDLPDLDPGMDDEPLELPEMDLAAAEEEETAIESVEELEFDLSDTGAFVAPPEEDEFSLDIDASELDIETSEQGLEATDSELDIDASELDIDSFTSELQEKTENLAGIDEETLEIEAADGLDLDFGLDAETPVATEGADDEEIVLDLTEDTTVIDLDMGNVDTGSDEKADEEDFDLSELDDVDEISTKLDLARAYLDMGDHEGTREILDEVLAEGNDEQKQEASELMAKLG